MRHSNSVQNPTEINLDAAKLDLPSGEEHNMPSQSSFLIPEYSKYLYFRTEAKQNNSRKT